MVVFVCFLQGATEESVTKAVQTVKKVRLSEREENEGGKRVSVVDSAGEILVIPQARDSFSINMMTMRMMMMMMMMRVRMRMMILTMIFLTIISIRRMMIVTTMMITMLELTHRPPSGGS